jgi:exodeoxyribonuclease V
MSWSPQQDAAIKAVRAWLADPNGPQVFRLFGFAGTGKTTLAKTLAEEVKGTVCFACFTGKASLVLRKKGCTGATTIHSLIYKPEEDPATGITEFKLNPESAAAYASLIVIDEVGMVGDELGQDLASYGTKILVLGDPYQLPPLKGEGYFTAQAPDIMLTEIHRQAQDNPIIRMSMDVREGRGLKPGAYGDSLVIRRASIGKDEMRDLVLSADQVLCGLNKTRQSFNSRIRQLRGMIGGEAPFLPVPGDRLVCLKNDKTKGLLNGGLWDVTKTSLSYDSKKVEMEVASVDEPGTAHVQASTPIPFFTGTEDELDWRDKKRADQFTYGYALTVHKSQGSQWPNVLVYDESAIFRETARNHLYTAVTRAAERVTVVV